jgi:murein DD-endopeptidase MepM/ murein hydrolase activator NlpD
LSGVSVKEGDVVQKGQLIGFSGKPISEFEHLHFELREGGVNQINCINPWKYLPYTPLSQNMKIEQADYIADKKSIKLLISTKPQELDFNSIEIEFLDKNNKTLGGNRKFDVDQVTKSTNEPTSLGKILKFKFKTILMSNIYQSILNHLHSVLHQILSI